MGNKVGSNHHSQDGYPVVVEMGSSILKGFNSAREEEEGKDPHKPDYKQFPQKQKEICHFVQDSNPDHISHKEEEGISSWGAKVFAINCHHNVGISVQKLDEFLQTPEAALKTAQQEPGTLILSSF